MKRFHPFLIQHLLFLGGGFGIFLTFVGCTIKQNASSTQEVPPSKTQEPKKLLTGPIEILHRNKNHELLWKIQAASSRVSYAGKQQTSGTLEKVQGELFRNHRVFARFSAERAYADENKDQLELQGTAKLFSESEKITLYANKILWLSSEKKFSATGNVRIETHSYTMGPLEAVKANEALTDIGTPDTFKDQKSQK
jgi:hypothetical protein